MGFNFPYGNKQQLNLDWFIKKFKELLTDWQNAEAGIAGSLQAEIDRAEAAMSDVFTARDAAISAKNDAVSAKLDAVSAKNSAENAATSANGDKTAAQNAASAAYNSQVAADGSALTAATNKFMAEAWATGEMNGSPVPSSAAQHENNAKYYAGEAASSASDAHADSLLTAADVITTGQNKDDTDLLKDAANAAALRSEGWADGTQNGTPVTSGSPYYQNNSKYFKEEAEDVLNSIPADYSELSAEVATQSEKIDNIRDGAYKGVVINGESDGYTQQAGESSHLDLISDLYLETGTYIIQYVQETTMLSNTRNTAWYYKSGGSRVYQSTGANRNLTAGTYKWEIEISTADYYTFGVWINNANVNVTISDFEIISYPNEIYNELAENVETLSETITDLSATLEPIPNELESISTSTGNKNIFNINGEWVIPNNDISITVSGDTIRLTTTANGSYQYAYQLIEIEDYSAAVSYSTPSGTGSALVRIGYYENGGISWVTNAAENYDIYPHKKLVVALYCTTTYATAGKYIDYKNIKVELSRYKTPYSKYNESLITANSENANNALYYNSVVKTIAHRGDDLAAPECTKSAYIAARKRGFEVAENDLNITDDGEFVMWHGDNFAALGDLIDLNGYLMYTDNSIVYYYDSANSKLYTWDDEYVESAVSVETLTRMNGSDYNIADLPFSVVSRIDVGAYRGNSYKGEQILTFDAWVLLCKQLGMEIYIDRKVVITASNAETLVNTVKKHGMLNHATWATGNLTMTQLIRQYDSNARIMLLEYPTSERITEFSTINSTGRGVVFNGDIKSLNATAVQLGLSSGYQVEGYYVDFYSVYTKAQAFTAIRNAVNAGMQAITTDHYTVSDAFYEIFI